MNTEKTVNNTNEARQRIHAELKLSILQFQLAGGNITTLKPQKKKGNRQVRGKEKLAFGTKKPVARPCVMFDNIQMVS